MSEINRFLVFTGEQITALQQAYKEYKTAKSLTSSQIGWQANQINTSATRLDGRDIGDFAEGKTLRWGFPKYYRSFLYAEQLGLLPASIFHTQKEIYAHQAYYGLCAHKIPFSAAYTDNLQSLEGDYNTFDFDADILTGFETGIEHAPILTRRKDRKDFSSVDEGMPFSFFSVYAPTHTKGIREVVGFGYLLAANSSDALLSIRLPDTNYYRQYAVKLDPVTKGVLPIKWITAPQDLPSGAHYKREYALSAEKIDAKQYNMYTDYMNTFEFLDENDRKAFLEAFRRMPKAERPANPTLDEKLFWATVDGDIDTMKASIEAGANVNYQEPAFGQTPLHAACYQRDMQRIEIIMATRKCNLAIKSKYGHPVNIGLPMQQNHAFVDLVEKYYPKQVDIFDVRRARKNWFQRMLGR